MELGTGFPGYNSLMPKSNGSIAEILKQTAQEAPSSQRTLIAYPVDRTLSLDTIASHNAPATAVALWATSMPSDFSALDVDDSGEATQGLAPAIDDFGLTLGMARHTRGATLLVGARGTR